MRLFDSLPASFTIAFRHFCVKRVCFIHSVGFYEIIKSFCSVQFFVLLLLPSHFFFVMEYSHIRAIVRVCEMCVCVFFSIFIYLLWLASQRVFFAYYVIRIGTLVARNGKEWEMSGTKKTFLHTQQHKRRETARTHARRARTNADRGNGSEQAAPAMPHIRFRSFSFFFFFYLAVSCFLLFFFCDLLFFS